MVSIKSSIRSESLLLGQKIKKFLYGDEIEWKHARQQQVEKSVCVCVYVRERERVCVCVCVCV